MFSKEYNLDNFNIINFNVNIAPVNAEDSYGNR